MCMYLNVGDCPMDKRVFITFLKKLKKYLYIYKHGRNE